MYKYYKSDFPLLLHTAIKRQTSTGELVPVYTDTPFNIHLYVKERNQSALTDTGYVATYDGETVHNCTILSDTDIMVYIDQSQAIFPVGSLYIEFEYIISDPHYEGDDENNLKRLYSTGITLTSEADQHDEGAVTVELFNEVIAKEIIALANQAAITVAEQTATEVATAKAAEVAAPVAKQVADEAFAHVQAVIANITYVTIDEDYDDN